MKKKQQPSDLTLDIKALTEDEMRLIDWMVRTVARSRARLVRRKSVLTVDEAAEKYRRRKGSLYLREWQKRQRAQG